MKVYIVSTCHPSCFIQHRSPFTLSFDVKSKMATDMLLPVILSEVVDSDDVKPRQGITRQCIKWRHQLGSFHNPIKRTYCGGSICIYWNVSNECGGLRNCFKAHRWLYLSTRNTRRSSNCINIQNDVVRIKCWMKQVVNRSIMKIVLNELENIGWKIC